MACLNDAGSGAGDCVRAVGGCVRDSLCGAVATDVDMATIFEPAQAKQLLEAAGFKIIPTGIKHGTLTIIADEFQYEITTLRQDIKTDGRHAIVQFGTDWARDAARRDFTINALYADARGRVYDPLGTGLEDLQKRHVRFIGNPAQRIREDYLRAIRFFRFHYHLGKGAMDEDARAACAAAAREKPAEKNGLAALSAERLCMELFKILCGNAPVEALNAMRTNDVLPFLLPELGDFNVLQQLVAQDKTGEKSDALLRVAASLPPPSENEAEDASSTDTATRTAQHLRFSNKQKTRLVKLFDPALFGLSADLAANWRGAVYWHGRQAVQDMARLYQAQNPHNPPADTQDLLKNIAGFTCPVFPLTGKMMQQAGLASGPDMGEISKHIEKWWVDSGFAEDINLLEAQLKAEIAKL